jgi:hypothetical protein
MGRDRQRKIQTPTTTAEVSIITRRYWAAGRAASLKIVRSKPKVALLVQRTK